VIKSVSDLRQVWFSPVSSTNKTDRHDITEILLNVALNTINQTNEDILHIEEGIWINSFFLNELLPFVSFFFIACAFCKYMYMIFVQ